MDMNLGELENREFKIKNEENRQRFVKYRNFKGKNISNSAFLSGISNYEEIGLYIHIPFCKSDCLYCDFYKVILPTEDKIENYIGSLKKELEILKEKSNLGDKKIISIHFGGGTPSFLDQEKIKDLILFIKNNLEVSKEASITLEANPNSIAYQRGRKKLKVLKESGINRISIGVQTFDDKILKILNRTHDSDMALSALKNAQNLDFDIINMDLIFGLPFQTPRKFLSDLKKSLEIKPDSLDINGLSIRSSGMWKYYLNNEDVFPDSKEILLMRKAIVKNLQKTEYKKGFFYLFKDPSLNYSCQTTYKKTLGVGASAASIVNNFRSFNFSNLKRYINSLQKDRLPKKLRIKCSKENLMQEYIIFHLLTYSINKADFKREFKRDINTKFDAIIRKMLDNDFIEDFEGQISLTDKGKVFQPEIAKLIYCSKEENRLFTRLMDLKPLKSIFLSKKEVLKNIFYKIFPS